MNNSKMIPQGSDQWHKVRLGRFTASQVYQIISEPSKKTGEIKLTKGAKTYIVQTAIEQITGERLKDFENEAMRSGSENEVNAAKEYQRRNKVFATSTGFWCFGEHSGGSPDKLIGLDGGSEFKCPGLLWHGKYLAMQSPADLLSLKKSYYWQCNMCMLATGRKWWDFVSYNTHKKLPKHLHLSQLRIYRDEKEIEKLRRCLTLAIAYKLQLFKRWKFKPT